MNIEQAFTFAFKLCKHQKNDSYPLLKFFHSYSHLPLFCYLFEIKNVVLSMAATAKFLV